VSVSRAHNNTNTNTNTDTNTRTNTHTHTHMNTRTHARTARTPAAPTAHSGRRPYCPGQSVGGAGAVRCSAVRGVDGTDEVGGPTPPARRGRVGIIDRRSASPFPSLAAAAAAHNARCRRSITRGLTLPAGLLVAAARGAPPRRRLRAHASQTGKQTHEHAQCAAAGRGCSACGSPAGRKENTQTAQSRAVARFMHARTHARTQARP
jgi:hypothetical protein